MATIEEVRDRIQRTKEKLEGEQQEAKTQKEMLEEAGRNDYEYIRLLKASQEASKALRLHREALQNEPEYRAIKQRIKEIKRDLKDCSAILSGELFGYTKEQDTFDIELAGGKLHRIQIRAKLVKTDQPAML